MQRETCVAVVGAGLAGLTAAYRLARERDAQGRPFRVVVLESADRIGGLVETVARDGFTIERAADSMITEKPWGLELCRDIGLESEIITTNAACRRSFVVRGARLHPVPEGFHLMAPSRLLPFARSGLLSWPGKLRVALEPFVPARRDENTDESLADFVRRRLGSEALERIAQPMVGGIYTADPERLSLRATLPRFLEMERKHGSVVRGLMAARRHAANGVAAARGPRYDLFVALTGGMGDLAATLARALPAGALRMRTPVKTIEKHGAGWRIHAGAETIEAAAVCVTAPTYAAAELIRAAVPQAAAELDAIEHASTATVTLAYRRDDIAHPLDGFGFVVPAVEGRTTLACTFSSVKFPGRAPAGRVLLRGFVGGALAPRNFELDDEAMTAAVEADVGVLLGARGRPLWSLVSRWPRSMPQYHVGHLARMRRLDAVLAEHPTLALAGSGYVGAGIPDTVRSANEAARRLTEGLAVRRAAEPRA